MFFVFLTLGCLFPCKARPDSVSAVTEGEIKPLPSQNIARADVHVFAGLRYLERLHIPSAYYGSIQLVTRQRAGRHSRQGIMRLQDLTSPRQGLGLQIPGKRPACGYAD